MLNTAKESKKSLVEDNIVIPVKEEAQIFYCREYRLVLTIVVFCAEQTLVMSTDVAEEDEPIENPLEPVGLNIIFMLSNIMLSLTSMPIDFGDFFRDLYLHMLV